MEGHYPAERRSTPCPRRPRRQVPSRPSHLREFRRWRQRLSRASRQQGREPIRRRCRSFSSPNIDRTIHHCHAGAWSGAHHIQRAPWASRCNSRTNAKRLSPSCVDTAWNPPSIEAVILALRFGTEVRECITRARPTRCLHLDAGSRQPRARYRRLRSQGALRRRWQRCGDAFRDIAVRAGNTIDHRQDSFLVVGR